MSRFERKAEWLPAVSTMKENRMGMGRAVIQERWWIENSGTNSGDTQVVFQQVLAVGGWGEGKKRGGVQVVDTLSWR